MSQQFKYLLMLLIVVIMVGLVWFLGKEGGGGYTTAAYVSTNWEDTYDWESQDPYGLSLFKERIEAKTDTSLNDRIETPEQLDSVLMKNDTAIYLFVGESFGLYDQEIDTLLSRVVKGSDLMIFSRKMTSNIFDRFDPILNYQFDYTTKLVIGKDTNWYKIYNIWQGDTLPNDWLCFGNSKLADKGIEVISTIRGRANFIRIPIGQGSVYLHTGPETFRNVFLLQKDGFRYAWEVSKRFNKGKKIRILDVGDIKQEPMDFFEEMMENKGGKKDDSYLQFIFKSPPLLAAMAMLLVSIILFVLFRAKRIQPEIPLFKKKRNHSAVFVETIASIYRNKDNPAAVLQLHRKNFYQTVLKHFFIDLSKRTDHREIHHLSERTGIDSSEIDKLLHDLEQESSISEDELVKIIKRKNQFYFETGLITEDITSRLMKKEHKIYRSVWLNFLLTMLGLSVIFIGTYFLVKANGAGILLWPLGAGILGLSFSRMGRPYVIIQGDEIHLVPLFGRKQTVHADQINRVELAGNLYIIQSSEGQKLMLRTGELGTQGCQRVERFFTEHDLI
jgi:hypothetical protein